MSMTAFKRCDKVTSKWEGGKVDHPKDPGGRTAYGVIQRVYDAYRKNKGLRTRDVYDIEEHERVEIYINNYWRLVRGDELRAGVDLVVYDCGVNSGPSRSIKILQASLNARGANPALKVDGVFGDATLKALKAETDDDALCAEFCRRRQAFVQALSTFATFGKGWTRRISGIKSQSQTWATGSVGTFLPVTEAAPHRADDNDVATTAVSVEKVGGAVGGVVTTVGVAKESGLGDTLSNIASQIEPYVGLSNHIQYAFVALIVAGALYAMWAAYKSHKASKVLKGDAAANVEDYTYEPVQSAELDKRRPRGRRKSRAKSGVRLAGQTRGRKRSKSQDKSGRSKTRRRA